MSKLDKQIQEQIEAIRTLKMNNIQEYISLLKDEKERADRVVMEKDDDNIYFHTLSRGIREALSFAITKAELLLIPMLTNDTLPQLQQHDVSGRSELLKSFLQSRWVKHSVQQELEDDYCVEMFLKDFNSH